MGVFVGVRGWLQCDGRQLTQIKAIVSSDDSDRTYGGGWAFPAKQYNWTNYVFFGADMRVQALDWFLEQLRAVARLPASDEDNDLVTGLFLVTHEVEGTSEWQVRDGRVSIGSAGDRYRYLDE